MKKSWVISLIIIALFIIPLACAQGDNLYQYDTLKVKISVSGKLDIAPEKNTASLKRVSADIALFPTNSFRQETLQTESNGGIVEGGNIKYFWEDGKIESKSFGYDAIIKTNNERVKVLFKVPYPLKDVSGVEAYMLPSETIDSNHPAVIAKANELAEGETDAFKVAFKLANWVEEKVQYDLNSLTATAAQKASWVLENKQGVCDEMTSLFVAMARSLGIPARFVSGISYTTSDKFSEKWQPHGWAEVYLPEIGWVSFDIAFGEYGYVDVTHIKLRDSVDPAQVATEYEWLAEGVKVEAQNLDFKVEVLDTGEVIEEDISLQQELLSHSIGLGSYNLVRGIVKNEVGHYAATTLQLAVPTQVEVLSRNKRTVLLEPKQVKETYWMLKTSSDLDKGYWYTFPTVIYNEKNISVRDEFVVMDGEMLYSEREVKGLVIEDEEKSYSRKVTFKCNYSTEIKVNSSESAECIIKNSGNVPLENIDFCVGFLCKIIDLPINQELGQKVALSSDTIGWNKLIVSARNNLIDKKTAFEYVVLDEPKIKIDLQVPTEVLFGNSYSLNLSVNKTSFNLPKKIEISVVGMGVEQKFSIDELRDEVILDVDLRGDRISKNNEYVVKSSWMDKAGNSYTEVKEVSIPGKGISFSDKVKMFFNGLMGWV